jgi:hypothetical protein
LRGDIIRRACAEVISAIFFSFERVISEQIPFETHFSSYYSNIFEEINQHKYWTGGALEMLTLSCPDSIFMSHPEIQ